MCSTKCVLQNASKSVGYRTSPGNCQLVFAYSPASCTERAFFPFPFALNGIWSWWKFSCRFLNQMEFHLRSKSKGKLSPRSYPIQCERKWKYSFLSVLFCTGNFTGLAALLEILQGSDVHSFERLASLGTMESRAPLKPLQHHSTMKSRGFKRAFNYYEDGRKPLGHHMPFFPV